MGGGLMQLVAYGAQDVYLTGSAQITFFKVIYRRHTNFSVEPIPQTFTGSSDFGRTVTCTINRNGDLITNMYVNVSLNAVTADSAYTWGYVRRLGFAIVSHYKIEIGGSKIDEQYGDWLNIWYELSHKVGQERGFSKMIGDVDELTQINNTSDKPAYQLYVPLQLWFNRNNGLALPLIALQYHDVRLTIDFRSAAQCVNSVGGGPDTIKMKDAQLIIDYIYLDSEERKRFAQASHEYLIEQLQFTGQESLTGSNQKYRLNFNHPCKYLIWAPHLDKYLNTQYVAYSASASGWEAARERAAKLLWVATRAGIVVSEEDGSVKVSNSSESGEVTDFPASESFLSAGTFDIANLVSAQLIQTTYANTSDDIAVNLDNIVILSNNLTMEHLSIAASDILYALTSASDLGTDGAIGETYLANHSVTVTDWFNYGNFLDGTDNPVYAAKLQLNGSDRFQERDGFYFNYVQPYQHFSNTPADGINVYSFALKPEDHQPSGTCNFSRIDNATLNVKFGLRNESSSTYTGDYLGSSSNINIYAVNYNVLRVMSGMAGAAYSN